MRTIVFLLLMIFAVPVMAQQTLQEKLAIIQASELVKWLSAGAPAEIDTLLRVSIKGQSSGGMIRQHPVIDLIKKADGDTLRLSLEEVSEAKFSVMLFLIKGYAEKAGIPWKETWGKGMKEKELEETVEKGRKLLFMATPALPTADPFERIGPP